jgi:3-oxoadipate enol-lactonase
MAVPTAFEVNGDGPAVVLIHGLGLNRNMWQWQLPSLTPHFRVLRYDLLGHGESDKPVGPYAMTDMVEQLSVLMNEVGIERAAIVGFSLGGLIAQAFALAHADKISALAILNSAHARSAADRQSIMERVQQVRESGPEATVDAALARWFSEDFAAANPEILDQVRRWVSANDRQAYPQAYKLLADADIGLENAIADIRCPTLVFTGEEDFGNSPQMAKQMAQKIAQSELHILPGLRHMALAEDPAAVNVLLVSFLRKNIENQ